MHARRLAAVTDALADPLPGVLISVVLAYLPRDADAELLGATMSFRIYGHIHIAGVFRSAADFPQWLYQDTICSDYYCSNGASVWLTFRELVCGRGLCSVHEGALHEAVDASDTLVIYSA